MGRLFFTGNGLQVTTPSPKQQTGSTGRFFFTGAGGSLQVSPSPKQKTSKRLFFTSSLQVTTTSKKQKGSPRIFFTDCGLQVSIKIAVTDTTEKTANRFAITSRSQERPFKFTS